MINPLYIYVGLAAASLGGLVAVSHDRWEHWPKAAAEVVVGKVGVETTPQPSPEQPKSAPAMVSTAPAPTAPAPAAPAPAAPAPAAAPSAAAPFAAAPSAAAQSDAPPQAPAPVPAAPQKTDPEQELAVLEQPDLQPAPRSAEAEKPSFDIVRVDPDGQAVVAGRSEPGAQVAVKINGETKGQAVANERGEWVWVTKDPIKRGSSEITIEARREPAAPPLVSSQAVDVVIGDAPGKAALVVLSEPSRPSKVMQSPEEQPLAGAPKVALAPPGEAATTAADVPEKAARPSAKSGPAKRPVSLDVVDYDDAGEIIFSGHGSPGATVRLYVDNNAVGDAAIDGQGGWTLSGRGRIAPGQHALRVDELGPAAKVESRVELPFVRAKPAEIAALAPPAAKSPSAPSAAAPAAPAAPEATQQPEPEATQKSDQLANGAAAPPPAATGTELAAPAMSSKAQVTPPVTQLTEIAPTPQTAAPAAEPAPAPQASAPAPSQTPAPSRAPEPPQAAPQAMGGGQAMAGLPEAAGPAGVPASNPPVAEAPRPRNGRIVIQPGNNLWNISRVIYGKGTRYTVIYGANKELIRSPRLIYPGQIFATPGSVPPVSIDPAWRKPLAEIVGDGPSAN